jgi:predicted metal-dependent phosphoesterase TrpH
VIDLHLHTTASDGLLAPDALVARLASAGIDTFSITDHDTVAGLAAASAAARQHALRFMPGIEITAVDPEGDIHMLGYGFDPAAAALNDFLLDQRAARIVRVRAMIRRLAELGMPIDEDEVMKTRREGGRTVGRPQIARALVARGFVASVTQAFDMWLGRGRPAYVERSGASPAEVIDIVTEAGGIVSMAHPGLTRRDELIQEMVERGLGAIEVWHSDHDAQTTERYRAQAAALGVLATGGSDYHGDSTDRPGRLGQVGLPEAAFNRLAARLRAAGSMRFIQDARA